MGVLSLGCVSEAPKDVPAVTVTTTLPPTTTPAPTTAAPQTTKPAPTATSPPTTTPAPTTTSPPTTTPAPTTVPPTTTPPPPLIEPGVADPNLVVDIYDPYKAYHGTTFLPFSVDPSRPRIVEVNMRGEILWEYVIPESLRADRSLALEAEVLSNNNVLFSISNGGIYEITREGELVWSHVDPKNSHDVDRLSNGNTLYVFGNEDTSSDVHVKEVNPSGELVWSWRAVDHFDMSPYNEISDGGWLHTNSVSRLENGNTLISPRNFNFLVEVDPSGEVLRHIGEGVFHKQHDPLVLSGGNILVANHGRTHAAVELNPDSGEVVWAYVDYDSSNKPVRDANRLPNGNTLITGTMRIFEVTPEGEVVWRMRLKGVSFSKDEIRNYGFYKADRFGVS